MKTRQTMRWTTLAALVALGSSGCASTKRSSGRAAMATASISMEGSTIAVRPTEVVWSMGEVVRHTTTVKSEELSSELMLGNVFSGPQRTQQALPAHVRLAAARAVSEHEADGLLLTNFLVNEERELGADITYEIELSGRLLHLSDLGVVQEAVAPPVETVQRRDPAPPEAPPPPPRVPPREEAQIEDQEPVESEG